MQDIYRVTKLLPPIEVAFLTDSKSAFFLPNLLHLLFKFLDELPIKRLSNQFAMN